MEEYPQLRYASGNWLLLLSPISNMPPNAHNPETLMLF
jgi:hypothetical protein